jgi:hypothetical protein
MMRNRKIGILTASFAAFANLFFWTSAKGQEEVATGYDDEEVMEEIVVVVNKSGDPVDVDALYLDQLRTRVIKDFETLQAEQEKEVWRQGLQTSYKPPESRISWGYDAKEEAAMRRSSINDLPTDRVKPATIISVSF